MTFTEIPDIESKDFDLAMNIYADAFPLNERQPISTVRERVGQGMNQLYAGRIDEEIVFMALLWPLKNTDFILLDYMATSSAHRGKNIGSHFLQSMRPVLEANKKHFILEVENPEFGDNKEDRLRRIDFYKKNGAKELRGVRYILPALDGSVPTEMRLMIFPEYNDGTIDASLVEQLITRIYKELYNRDAKDMLPEHAVFDPGTRIELI